TKSPSINAKTSYQVSSPPPPSLRLSFPKIYSICIIHLPRLSPAELANTITPTDPMPKALTDRTNTPAINTAAFRKLDGNILAAVSVESAKKVGNKAAGHNGKRTESDQAPKVSALEDPYGKDEDKKNKRAMEERGLDISQNLPKGHPNNDMFDKEKKDRRGDGLGTSREISSSDADTNPHDIRSNTLPLHKCGSAICLLRRAFNSLTSKRDAPP
ncbi:MAG: hypothetical protein Q9198_010545, partial [Flavoplaca austrocitrina]